MAKIRVVVQVLHCEQCNQEWQREPKRGKAPKVCPKCAEATKKYSPPARQPYETISTEERVTNLIERMEVLKVIERERKREWDGRNTLDRSERLTS